MVIRMIDWKFVENTLLCWAANIVPASAATIAPKLNAITFTALTGIDIADAASGSSRTARHARPVREVSSKCSATISRISTITSANRSSSRSCRPDLRRRNPCHGSNPLRPKRPLLPPRLVGATLLTASANACPTNSVTIAR